MLIFKKGKVFLDGSWKTGFDILVHEGKIQDIKPEGTLTDGETVDAEGCYISPGFIDLHIHGSHGSDVMDANPEALENISSYLASNGTTSYLATTMTHSMYWMKKSVRAVHEYMRQPVHKGAQIIGVHLEGPFLSPMAKGAHDEKYLMLPTKQAFDEMTDGCLDIVRLITIAPELEGALELSGYLRENNVTVSIGHTNSTYDICTAAISSGVTHVCHFYNAMTPLNHRKPGAVGAILDHDKVTIELIADLIHIHPAALRLAAGIKGKDRTVLITDAMAAAGLSDGLYELGGLEVHVKDGAARLKDGTLAGSTLNQNQALINMIKTGLPSEEVIPMLTETPAREIGMSNIKGRIEKGYDADIVLLDNDFKIKSTYVKGLKQ